MKKVEAYLDDSGALYRDKIDCAKADLYIARNNLRAVFTYLMSYSENSSAPREDLRKSLTKVESALRTFKQCLSDLDHYDEDETDPERIRQALAEHRRVAVRLMEEVRWFFTTPEGPR